MSITNERLHELAAIAEAATPGPWRRSLHIDFPSETGYEVFLPPADGGPYGTGGRVGEASTKMDATHITAFDPTTARALIAEVLALRERVETLTEGLRSYGRTIDRWGALIIAATGSEDITTADGDGDWEVIEERLRALGVTEEADR